MDCPICEKKFEDLDIFISHICKCRDEQRRADELIRKEKMIEERENRYKEVQNAYTEVGNAKKAADELMGKFIRDYPESTLKGNLCPTEIGALEKAFSQLFGY